MSGHTPGPWMLSPNGSHVRLTLHGFNICTLNENLDEEAPANARLIASAPALLAALRDLVTRCDGEEGTRADGSNIDTLEAHAAIAAAEGKQT